MTSFKQKLKSKLGEFASILQVGYFLYKNYLSRSLIAVILSFFSCLSETIGVLTIIPVFLIISGEKNQDSGFVNTVYQYFSDLGLTDNLITILIFFIFAISLKSLLRLVNAYVIGNTFALIAKEYRLKVMDVIYRAEWNYFVRQKTGILANSISSEPEKAGQAFNYFIKFINAFVQLCFYLFISFAASTIVTFSAFIYAILLFLIIIFVHKHIALATQGIVKGIENMTARITEYLLLLKPIKAMESGLVLKKFLDIEANKIKVNQKKQLLISEIVASLQEPLVAIFICGFFYLSINVFFFNVTEIIFLSFIFYRLMAYLSLLQVGYLNVIRLDKFMQNLNNTISKATSNKEEHDGRLSLKLNSDIIFDKVTFCHTNKKLSRNYQ